MLKNFGWRLKQAIYAFRHAPNHLFARECPICGYSGLFGPYGYPVRPEARCPRCASLERHRVFRLWLEHGKDELAGKRVLHFAPERAMTAMIKPLASAYVTADLVPGRADLALNIERTGLPADSYDAIVCSHVLEHVDDAAALAEFTRILAPGGVAMLMVPIVHGWDETYESAPATTDAERLRHYGQIDHVRRYGADFAARVIAAGFTLETFDATPDQAVRYGINPGNKIYLARPR